MRSVFIAIRITNKYVTLISYIERWLTGVVSWQPIYSWSLSEKTSQLLCTYLFIPIIPHWLCTQSKEEKSNRRLSGSFLLEHVPSCKNSARNARFFLYTKKNVFSLYLTTKNSVKDIGCFDTVNKLGYIYIYIYIHTVHVAPMFCILSQYIETMQLCKYQCSDTEYLLKRYNVFFSLSLLNENSILQTNFYLFLIVMHEYTLYPVCVIWMLYILEVFSRMKVIQCIRVFWKSICFFFNVVI